MAWNGGEFSFGPIEIMPGAGRRLDIRALAESEYEDLLGRRAPRDFDTAFLQWTAHRGSQELIARTEALPRGGDDRFGFNCFGCCYEMPSGAVSPDSIAFDIGESPSFGGVSDAAEAACLSGVRRACRRCREQCSANFSCGLQIFECTAG